MPRVTDPALLAQLETPQTTINKGASAPTSGPRVNSNTASAALAKVAAVHQLRQQLGNVEKLYAKHLKGVGPGSLLEYLPLPQNRAFDAAADGLLPLARQAFRVPGSGADSDKEQEALIRALLPRASEYDSVNEQRMSQLRQMIDSTEREWGPIAGVRPAPAPPARKAPPAPRVVDFNALPR